jgi:acyl-CoA synthetase (AMP-forming)/AMP-acid ligase II
VPSTLPGLLRHRARRHRSAPAFSVGGTTRSYGEWYEHARSWYGALADRGLRPGDRVLLEFQDEDWHSFSAAFVAVLAFGGVAVPLRQPLPAGRRDELARLLGVAGSLDTATTSAGDGWSSGRRRPSAPASIILTSGTTGTPRAVVCPHADLVPDWTARLWVHPPRSRAALTSAAVGTVAAQAVIAGCLTNGAHTVVANPFDPSLVADQVEAYGVTAMSLVPATARLLVQALERSGRKLPSVLSVVSSSAPLDQALVSGLAQILPSARITNVYSMTEGGPSLVADCAPDQFPTLGRLAKDVRLVDPDGNDVGPDSTGELWLRANPVGRSYLHGSAGGRGASAGGKGPSAGARFMAGGWIATGDLCRRDTEGVLTFVDRGDDVIVSGGLNIASAVVEATIRDHPGVRDVAVFGVPHPVLGRVAVAAVVLAEGTAAAEVRAHCVDRLPPEQVPRDVTVVDDLPVTASGKVRKAELAGRYREGAAPEREPGADDHTEQLVMATLREALGTALVDADSNFYLIGGHSLQAAKVAADLSDRLKVDVPAGWLLRYPVVREFANQIARLRRP